MTAGDRREELIAFLRAQSGVLLAFSGGVDSSLLAKAALLALPRERVLAVTASSPIRPRFELEEAKDIAASLGLPHIIAASDELSRPEFAANPPERCYLCKLGLYARLWEIAKEHGLPAVIDGTNADDGQAYRPGRRAASALGIGSPLARLGFGKEEIRALSRSLGLPNWSRPAYSCLATRFPYGTLLTEEKLRRVERGEDLLRGLSLRVVRLRDHFPVARLEAGPEEMERAFALRGEIAAGLKQLGYGHITLDLEGYRSGSFDEGMVGDRQKPR